METPAERRKRLTRERVARHRAKQPGGESGRAVPASELLDGPAAPERAVRHPGVPAEVLARYSLTPEQAEQVAAHLRGELSVRELAGESYEQWVARTGRTVSGSGLSVRTSWAGELVPLPHPPNYAKPAHDAACDCRRCHRGA